jgi:hypothetical protein
LFTVLLTKFTGTHISTFPIFKSKNEKFIILKEVAALFPLFLVSGTAYAICRVQEKARYGEIRNENLFGGHSIDN